MAAVNGVLTPQIPQQTGLSPPKPSSVKRKRTGSDTGAPHQTYLPKRAAISDPFDDVLQILRTQDLEPPILGEPFEQNLPIASSRSPNHKRTKLQPSQSSITVAAKVEQNAYTSLTQFEQDVRTLCATRRHKVETFQEQPDESGHTSQSTQTLAAVNEMRRIEYFEQFLANLLAKASAEADQSSVSEVEAIPTVLANNIKKEDHDPRSATMSSKSKTVLTIFGNASLPRQLFSSLQHDDDAQTDLPDVPLEQLGLPNMMSTSRLLPCRPEYAVAAEASKLTFGRLFSPAPSSAPLLPPKPNKPQIQGNATLTFSLANLTSTKLTRNSGYTAQPLKTARWLGYGHNDGDFCRPSSLRRHRQSSVGRSASEREKASQFDDSAHEKSMFHAAFSSFAPTYDNSHAIISHRDVESVWWRRNGARQFSDRLGPVATLDDDAVSATNRGEAQEAERFRIAVDAFEDTTEEIAAEFASQSASEDKDTEQLLGDVTDLTATLASFQEIRNSQIRAVPAGATVKNIASEPSAEEVEVYRQLRTGLAELVSRTAPYLVAKFDGEQAERLRLRSRLRLQGARYNGVMEEDQAVRAAQAASAAAATLATQKSQPSSAYNRNPAPPPTTVRPPRPNQYTRAGSTSMQNTPISASRASSFAPVGNTANRMGSSYGAVSDSQNASRAVNYVNTSNGITSPSTGSPIVGHTANPRAPGYARMAPASAGPSVSPHPTMGRPATYSPAIPPQKPPTPVNSASAVSTAQVPVDGPLAGASTAKLQDGTGTPQAGGASAASNGGPTGFHTSMTTEQQQMIMDRQRAQLAAQPQALMAAQPKVPQAPMVAQVPQTPVAVQNNGTS